MDKAERERTESDRREAMAFAAQAAKWTYSSLLVVNGAALVAILNAADKLPAGALLSGLAFANGLISALGAGGLAAFAAVCAASSYYWELRGHLKTSVFAFVCQMAFGIIAFVLAMTSLAQFGIGVVQVSGFIKAHSAQSAAGRNAQVLR